MIGFFKKLYSRCSDSALSFIDRAKMTEHTFTIILALIIGVLGGFGAIAIRTLIRVISNFSFSGYGTLLEKIASSPWYILILAPTIGGFIVGPLIHFFAREAKGHGVPEVMQAIILQNGKIRPRVAFVKALASSISIGSGGSVGREGPIVQIGASLGSSVAQFFRISGDRMKTLVGCGAAAGIAAAFNAPIAGALFAVEIILMDFAFAQLSPIVISAVLATVISHHFEGNFVAFQVPDYQLIHSAELIFYAILGAFSGIISYLFIKVLYFSEDVFDNRLKMPEYLKPCLGGLLIGIIALTFPQIMGVGYDSINDALHGNLLWQITFMLIFVKIIATSLCLGSGASGGIFAPSLFIGAMLGCSFGSFIHQHFPDISATPGAYALVAMGGLVAGTTRAPITAIIIVFELTNDYNIILPLMITCIISTIVSSKLSRESIYTLKLILRNIHIKEGTEINLMKSLFVRDIYSKDYESINEKEKFSDIVNIVLEHKSPYFIVVSKDDDLVGMIAFNEIKEYLLKKEDFKGLIVARDVATQDIATVNLDDHCQTVLDKMKASNVSCLPVVASEGSRKILGVVWKNDILDAYQREIERRDVASTLIDRIQMKHPSKHVHFMEGYSTTEIPVPKIFLEKSIKSLNVRARYNVEILSVKQKENGRIKSKVFPDPDYIFKKGDVLIIAGAIEKINFLKHLD